jgi:flagellar motility protein MotE (MotC chaperone)
MVRILQSSWFVALIGCLLYLATTAALLRPEQFAGAASASATAHVAQVGPGNDPSWKFRNPEFEQWVDELRHEKEALATREQQLTEWQARLDAERQEILAVTQTVYQLQSDFDHNVVRLKEQELENLKRETKVIAGMSPEGTAAMFNEMGDDEAVKILFMLKPDNVSLILDSMSKLGKVQAKRAATLSQRMREVLPPGPGKARPTPPG